MRELPGRLSTLAITAVCLALALVGEASAESWTALLYPNNSSRAVIDVQAEPDGAWFVHRWAGDNRLETGLTRFDEQGRRLVTLRHADSGSTEVWASGRLADGGFLLAGQSCCHGGDSLSLTWRTDSEGRPLEGGQRSWVAGERSRIEALAVAPDGGAVFAHRLHLPNPDRLLIEQRDGLGNRVAVWELPGKTAAEPLGVGWIAGVELAALADGRFLIASQRSLGSGSLRTYLACFLPDGEILWEGELTGGGPQDPLAGVLVALPDGGFLAGGYVKTGPDSNSGWLARFDAAGLLLWERRLDGPRSTYVGDIAIAGDGTLLVVGRELNEAWIARFTQDGDAIDAEFFDDAAGGSKLSFHSVAAADGGAWVGYSTGSGSFGSSGLLYWEPGSFPMGDCLVPGIVDWAPVVAGPTALEPVGLDFVDFTELESEPVRPRSLPAPEPLRCASCLPDDHEPDDGCGEGLPISHTGAGLQLNACDDATDWLDLGACAGRSFTIRTRELGPASDTILELFDQDCSTLLASDDNGGGGAASLLSYTAADDRQLFLRVRQADGGSGPDRDYKLDVSFNEVAPAWTGSWQIEGLVPDGFVAALPSATGLRLLGTRSRDFALEHWLLDVEGGGAPTRRIAWQELSDWDESSAHAVAELEDGSILLAGRHLDQISGSIRGGHLSFREADGSHRQALSVRDVIPTQVAARPGGGSLVLARHAGGDDVVIVAFDALDAEAWTRLFEPGSNNGADALSIAPDGAAWLGGTARIDSDTRGWIGRVDTLGNLEFAQSFALPERHSEVFLSALSDGGCAVATSGPAGVGLTDIELRRFDADGSLIWERAFDLHSGDRVDAFAARPDGSLLIVGMNPYATERDHFVAHVSSEGEPVMALLLPRFGDWAPARLQLLSDGRVAIGRSDGDTVQVTILTETLELTEDCEAAGPIDLLPVAATPTDPVALALMPWTTDLGFVTAEDNPLELEANGTPACDCLCSFTAEPTELSPPGSASPLRVDDGGLLSWESPEFAGACRTHVYRGLVADLHLAPTRGSECLGQHLARAQWRDDGRPGEGSCFYYVVVGVSATGGEGSLGEGSEGDIRSRSFCPRYP